MFNDPISNMINIILCSYTCKLLYISFYYSKIKFLILNLLNLEGYIGKPYIINKYKKVILIKIKYYRNKPVINFFKRVSKPSLRVYRGYKHLPRFMNGLGIFIISTTKGLMTDKTARKLGIGGEVLCYVF